MHNAVMGERQVGPLGLHLELDSGFFRSFSAEGCFQRLVPPNPLGTPGWQIARAVAASAMPAPPKVATFVRPKVSTADLRKLSPGEQGLLDRLYAKQVGVRGGTRKAIMGLPEGQRVTLKDIDGRAEFAADVAPKFKEMWQAMREARNIERPDVTVSVASSYRNAEQDERAWQKAVRGYLTATKEARLATGDPFGETALEILFAWTDGKKAPSGFSGHTRGIAADLTTTEKGRTWTVISRREHQIGWQSTWLYKWLVEHAAEYGFLQLKKETWHWEYHETKSARGCYAGDVTIKQRRVPG